MTTVITAFLPRIPAEAWNAMLTKRPAQVYKAMLAERTITYIDARTFAYVITPIQLNATGDIIAYVLFWPGDVRTIHTVADGGESLPLLATDPGPCPSPDDAVALWEKYRPALDGAGGEP